MTALIWDLDGTLIDSYPSIVRGLRRLTDHFRYDIAEEDLLAFVKRTSVRDFLAFLDGELPDVDPGELRAVYARVNGETAPDLPAMQGAGETLERLGEMGVRSFLFTHKGGAARDILARLELLPYFEELVTSDCGFLRKPAPEGILYLVEKHRLDPARTFYVGDRDLDVQCARSAGVGSILLKGPWNSLRGDIEVRELLEIPSLVKMASQTAPAGAF